jgi:hypothetical protein
MDGFLMILALSTVVVIVAVVGGVIGIASARRSLGLLTKKLCG